MKINSIKIENFRNIEDEELSFDDINIIYGENAQGKTNLLEALYLFSGAKSFRGVKDKELVRFNCEYAKLQIDFFSRNREQTANILINNKRTASLNKIDKKSPAALSDEIKTIIFSPIHLSMIKDGPQIRRKFVDTALCQIKSGYSKIVKEYKRSLLQRNSFLKDVKYHPEIAEMFPLWNENTAKYGAKIIYQREKYIEALEPIAKEIFFGLSSGKENLSINLDCGFDVKDKTQEEIEESLKENLIKNQSEDVINQVTSVGPHRDDIEISINSISARKYASQGQQRSAVLALKLAEADLLKNKCSVEPIVLLDDVMSELDEKRQDYILNNMKNRQIFITCCDANTVLRLKSGRTFKVENGRVTENEYREKS